MLTRNRFGRQGTFICQVCDRRTRDAGNGIDHLCPECYDIAGLDNMVNDHGYKPGSPEYASARAECDRLLAKAVKQGSNGDAIRESNGFIWGQDAAPIVAKAGWTRDKVAVDGVVYDSTRKAWAALDLPAGRCGGFRKLLKAGGVAVYLHGKKETKFTIVR